jgi:hypothetical protein
MVIAPGEITSVWTDDSSKVAAVLVFEGKKDGIDYQRKRRVDQ